MYYLWVCGCAGLCIYGTIWPLCPSIASTAYPHKHFFNIGTLHGCRAQLELVYNTYNIKYSKSLILKDVIANYVCISPSRNRHHRLHPRCPLLLAIVNVCGLVCVCICLFCCLLKMSGVKHYPTCNIAVLMSHFHHHLLHTCPIPGYIIWPFVRMCVRVNYFFILMYTMKLRIGQKHL